MPTTVTLLGAPHVVFDGESFALPPGKSSALLYYLAYQQDWVSRDELVYLFWPDSDESSARRNLRQLLTTLRRLPYADKLETETSRVRWQIGSDASAFKKALGERNWLAATEVYSGELLQTFKPTDLPDFEEWLELERQELQKRYREAVFTLAGELEATDRHASAADLLEKLLKTDSSDEEVLRRHLRALHHSGQRRKALEAFETFRQTLERELGGEPEPATLELVTTVRKDTAFTANPVAEKPNHNLFAQLTPFVGREAIKEKLTDRLVGPGCRLLTLVGPGGIGKTRLALEVAREQLEAGAFKDGVWFVNLAPVSSPDFIVSAIADALRFSFYGAADPKQQLLGYLRDKELLLVLDNFEQLVSAAPLVTEVLTVGPGVKALVTSREVLNLYGEQEFPVPPLALPDPKQLSSLMQLSTNEAVAIFIQRALAVKPDFQMTAGNAPAVAEICHRLDGLPLAIELAAARVKLFSPQALLARLSNRLQVLTGGAQNLPKRQQTLRNTLEWGYSLLEPGEEILFARLAVFVGGRSLEAIEAVCNREGDSELDITEGVGSLVGKSLLRQEEGLRGEPRFVMLETVQEFAREKIEHSGEAEAIRRAHAAFFLALAEEAEPHLTGPGQAAWLERLETEHDNFRAALRWVEKKEADMALSLAGSLWRFWLVRGHYSEGREWLAGVLAQAGTARTAARAKALRGAGTLAGLQGDYVSMRSLYEESLAIYQELGDKQGIAAALGNLGATAGHQGDYASARSLLEESLARNREIGDRRGIALALNNVGEIAANQGNYASARSLFEESLTIVRELGDKQNIATALGNLGLVAYLQADYASARPLLKETLTMVQKLGDKEDSAYFLEVFAALIAAEGKPEQAARLYGAAEALREAIGAPLHPSDSLRYERDVAAARAQLDETAWTAAWAAGRRMSTEEAVAYALETDPT